MMAGERRRSLKLLGSPVLGLAIVPMLLLCGEEVRRAESQTLLIDDIEFGGKAHLAQIGKGIVVTDLFGHRKIKWLISNRFGRAVCCIEFGAGTAIVKLDALGGGAGPVIIDSSKLPTVVEGDLSPDGTALCFRALRGDEKGKVHVLRFEDGEVEAVTESVLPVSPPTWSSDGSAIAYYLGTAESLGDDSYRVAISERSEEGWKEAIVAPPSKRWNHGLCFRRFPPEWGPDGKSVILGARYREEENGPHSYIVAIDGSGLTRIGDDCYATPGSFPGHEVVTYAVREKGIYAFNCRTHSSKLLFPHKDAHSPRLSPDKELVAYCDSHATVFVANSDGSNRRRIVQLRTMMIYNRFRWLSPRRTISTASQR